MNTFLSTVDYKGLSVEVKFASGTNELASKVTIWASKVTNGAITSLAPISV
jgi:hypothetical protein